MPKLSLLPRPSNVSGSASKDPSFRSLPFSYGKGQGETETPTQTVEGVSSLPGVVQPPYRAGSGARLSSPTSLVRYLPPKISICTQRSRCPEIPRGGTEKILPPASTEIQKYRDLCSYDRDLCVTNRLRGASPVRPTVRKKRQKKAKSATHVRCFARSSRRLERPRAPFEERGRRRKAQERIRKARLRSKRNTREGRPALRRGPARDGKYLLERRRRRLKQRKRDERREKNLGSGGNGEATRRDQTHGRDGKHTYNPKKRKDRHQVAHGDALLGVQVDFQAALRNVQD